MYSIEERLASKAGWHTPAEARAHYGRYSRDGITVHWWNSPDKAGNHDQTVNYILGQAAAGNMSINYVVSDQKITLCVGPDNVAWHSMAGNPTTIGVEFDPRLGNEGYKKAGWLVAQLESRYGKTLALYPHKHWNSTACPGTIDINRIRNEADKWKSGFYNLPAPQPVPTKGDEQMPIRNAEFIKNMYRYVGGREPSQGEIDVHMKGTPESLLNGFVQGGDLEVNRLRSTVQQQQTAIQNAQTEAAKLRQAIHEIEQVKAMTDKDVAAKEARLADLNDELNNATSELQKALLEIERLNNVVCKVPEPKAPESFKFLEKLLSIFIPKKKV